VSSDPAHARCTRSIQHYVIKFVSDLLQVGGFLSTVNFQQRERWHTSKPRVPYVELEVINFWWLLCCLSFFDLRFLITHLGVLECCRQHKNQCGCNKIKCFTCRMRLFLKTLYFLCTLMEKIMQWNLCYCFCYAVWF
jgi:hypothetical protein